MYLCSSNRFDASQDETQIHKSHRTCISQQMLPLFIYLFFVIGVCSCMDNWNLVLTGLKLATLNLNTYRDAGFQATCISLICCCQHRNPCE